MDTELLSPMKQTLWGRLAVVNFFLGGAGAGAYLVAVSLAGFSPTPLVRLALILGPLLVLAGFLSVAVEAGRPLRGPKVLRRVETSWMSRESWAGGAFIALAALDFVAPWVGWRLAAAPVALLFVLAQGWVLSNCRGVLAWNVPILPLLFLASALVSGAGVLSLAAPFGSGDADRLPLATAALILLSGFAWVAYSLWPGNRTFRQVVGGLREDSAVLGIFVVGHLLPLALLVLGRRSPALAAAAAALAGIGVLSGQLQAKARLILKMGVLRPITIASLGVRTTAEIAHGK
ncbi:MAG: polysulfide reductase NrfD [Candidatus Rokubacteria bacterium]|nr:polysulfide reductase NrfD [Candidatus Rokubacteria bacterium]